MTPRSKGQLTRMLATFAAAAGVDRFDIGALDHASNRMSAREDWNRGQVWRATGWMAARNATGSSIYVRPARALKAHPWILVDDLTANALETVRAEHPPGIVVETSPSCFQAWIRLTRSVPVEVRTTIARSLMRRYGGDPGGAGGRQFGRCPGTTNQKPERQHNGRARFAALRHAGPEIATTVEIPEMPETPPTRLPLGAAADRSPTGAGVDQSARDFGIACRLIEAGRHDDEIARAIREVRRKLGDPKGQRADYIERTIRAARRRVAQGERR